MCVCVCVCEVMPTRCQKWKTLLIKTSIPLDHTHHSGKSKERGGEGKEIYIRGLLLGLKLLRICACAYFKNTYKM